MKEVESNKDIIRLTDKVEVVATSKDMYHKQGTVYKVHPKHVDYLVEKGLIEKNADK